MTQHARITMMSVEEPTILGVQFFPRRHYTPEQKLLWAVFEEMLQCYGTGIATASTRHGRALLLAQQQWIQSDAYYDDCFSFRYICDSLGLDCEYIRQKLLALSDRYPHSFSVVCGQLLSPRRVSKRRKQRPLHPTLFPNL